MCNVDGWWKVAQVQHEKAHEGALLHLRQAVQESLNLALLKTEVFADLSDIARALKGVAQRYFAQRCRTLSAGEIRAFVHRVPDEMERLMEGLVQGLARCHSEVVRRRFLDQIERFYFARNGRLRSATEMCQMVDALNVFMTKD